MARRSKLWYLYVYLSFAKHSCSVLSRYLLLLLLSCFSRVWLCATPETAAHQAPLSLGFSRQEHWSGLPFPSPVHESEKWKWSRSSVSDSLQPHGLQPTRLLHPWDFPGKSTGVGCHRLLQVGIYVSSTTVLTENVESTGVAIKHNPDIWNKPVSGVNLFNSKSFYEKPFHLRHWKYRSEKSKPKMCQNPLTEDHQKYICSQMKVNL